MRGVTAKHVLVGAAVLQAAGEFGDTISVGAVGAVMGLLFLASVVWIRRGGRGGVAAAGLLSLLEVAGVPFYSYSSTGERLFQIAFGLVGAVGVGAAIGTLRASRRVPEASALDV